MSYDDFTATLVSENARLKAEVEIYKAGNKDLLDWFNNLKADFDTLRAENERLRAALQWYADPKRYEPHPHGLAFERRDLSYVARAALAAQPAPKEVE